MSEPYRPPDPPNVVSRFRVNLITTNVPAEYRSTEYMVWLNDMKLFFEKIIVGLVSWPNDNITLDLTVYFAPLDDGLLAQCGPGNGDWADYNSWLLAMRWDNDTHTATPYYSTMTFNTNYYKANPVSDVDREWKRQFFTTAVHECFHGVGFGSLWNGPFRIITNVPLLGSVKLSSVFPLNVVGAGNPTNPQYIAPHALNEYRAQMVGQQFTNTIPIENYLMEANTTMANAGGTALAHWRGNRFGQLSGVVNQQGQDMINEVMTSWSSRDEGVNRWVGRFTLGALRDIGWLVNFEPLSRPLLSYKTV